ncbi:hypothetical protein RI509_13120 [Levilactobacillus namurensis]|uniref:hypothetical protein n=1 Tax=Levilactobacillus namurensis TaxID=380393 RepID=UPI0028B38486|nr:hypothetical protein [Levilactobacillus namurensis]MDT7020114.1 hypothetical protein [Levilactobacillus namurensis]
MAFVNPDSFANAVLSSRKDINFLEDALKCYEEAFNFAQKHNSKETSNVSNDSDITTAEQTQLLRDKGLID